MLKRRLVRQPMQQVPRIGVMVKRRTMEEMAVLLIHAAIQEKISPIAIMVHFHMARTEKMTEMLILKMEKISQIMPKAVHVQMTDLREDVLLQRDLSLLESAL